MEEFNDNVFETRTNRQADLITRITPGFNLQYAAPLWDWNINYNPEYRTYARGTMENQLFHNLSLVGTIRPIDNFLYINVSNIYSQAPIDGNRNSLYTNQTDQNIFSISPYIQYRIDPRWTGMLGYRYVNRYYSNSNSINNQEQAVFLRATREINSKLNVFTHVDAAYVYFRDGTFHQRLTHSVGTSYQYAEGSSVTAQGGYSLFFPQNGNATLSPYWTLGLIHGWDAYTFNLNSGISYDTDSTQRASERRFINTRLTKIYKRGTLGIFGTYTETLNSQANTTSSRWFTVGADANHELGRRTSGHASISTDKYLDNTNISTADVAYRNSFTVGVRYELNYDLWLGLDYNRIAYSRTPFVPTGPIEVNRIMLYLTKSFQGGLYKSN
jgi:hypothetical protein